MVHYTPALGSRPFGWEYADGDRHATLAPPGAVSVRNVQTYHGAGLARVGLIQAGRSSLLLFLPSGELVDVLAGFSPQPLPASIVVAYRHKLSRRVRLFVAWLEEILAPRLVRQRGWTLARRAPKMRDDPLIRRQQVEHDSIDAAEAKPRADSARNRETLIAVATEAFASAEDEPSMRAIARAAGVGIATLYRHFPTRESLVEAVYQDQVQRLTRGARELLKKRPPDEALRRWMDLFANWLATKHGMTNTLLAMIDSGNISHLQTRDELLSAIATILDAGSAAGVLRADVSPEDIAASLLGIFTVAGKAAQRPQARRLLDLLMAGLRP